jgi:DNA-binding transcriptional LysR family regulator
MHDPRRLLTLRAVVAEGSFSAAARALSLTQPAVSQQVAALEREVGAELLVRGPGGARVPAPTAAGALLLDHADALADRLAQADAQVAELTAHPQPLRLGAYPSALAVLVPRAIAALDAPAVQATEGRLPDLWDAIAAGRLHVAIVFEDAEGVPREAPGVERRELGEEDFVAMVGPHHRLARRRTIRVAELSGDVWTAPSTTGLVTRAARRAGFEPRVAFTTFDPLTVRALVMAGLAVTLSPRLVAEAVPGPRLLDLREESPRRRVLALLPATGARPDARAFADALLASWPNRARR